MLGVGKKDRRQPTRAAAPSAIVASSEYIRKRIQRHLNDLERTNYTEPSSGGGNYAALIAGGHVDKEDDEAFEREDSSSVQPDEARSRKKQGSKNVRQLLLYRKNLAQLVTESVTLVLSVAFILERDPDEFAVQGLQDEEEETATTGTTTPAAKRYNYLTIASEPSTKPPVQMCSVCGYRGKYVCRKCGNRVCDLGCKVTHDESRCERR
ncbi:Vps71p [Sporobolomyces koalae]|uniref:Vps71p n=1 Tax=Sporobolomyces koalae TaxID=500713 RepID=UPI0031743842